MELIPGVVRLPRVLDEPGVSVLARDLDDAWASDAPVVTLVGHDAATFCHGVALDEVLDRVTPMHAFATLLGRLHASPKPLLALVDGEALGGGLGLACASDWVVATERATFGLPELLWGLAPAIIWPVVTDRMAPHVARRWTVAAHARSAAEALAAGVADELSPTADLARAGRRAARALARLDPHALAQWRAWSRAARQFPLAEAVTRGVAITAALAERPAARARRRAFASGDAPWSA